MPADPTKDDYVFDGWYWDNNSWQRPFTANSLLVYTDIEKNYKISEPTKPISENSPNPNTEDYFYGWFMDGRFGHPYQDRAISIREAARLQTFPDDFEFGDSLGKAALQIGNAVPVKLVEASAKEIMRYIKILDGKSNG